MAAYDLRGKTLLVLDGSRKAIEIVEHAQSLGSRVIVTDYNEPLDSPAKTVADAHFKVSTTDVESIVALIKEQQIDGVLPGFSDRWLPVYAEICQLAGLPSYATPKQLQLFTNKEAYKALLAKHGVPTVEGYSLEQARKGNIPSEAYPLIVKPAGGSGSRGITLCRSESELFTGIDMALAESWADSIVIERFLPNPEATAYWVFQDGEYHLATLANRHMFTFADGSARLPIGYTQPSSLLHHYQQDIVPKVKAVLREAGILNGIMFMQGMVHEGEFLTYDIGFRPTPTQEYKVLEELCDYNPLSMLITFALTGSMGEPQLEKKVEPAFSGYGFNVSTLAMPGRIGKFTGLQKISQLPGVLSISKALSEGEILPPEGLGQLRQVVVRTVGVASSIKELEEIMNQIASGISVVSHDGEPLTVAGSPLENLEAQLL